MIKIRKHWFYLVVFLLFIAEFFTIFRMGGPFIFPDEPCVLVKARYLAENLVFKNCSEIVGFTAGNPFPLYSTLISPIYFFLSAKKAYYAILIFNLLLSFTLIFPLMNIFRMFVKNERIAQLNVLLILLLPHLVTYEKMLMTENLFLIVNVWFLYFYLRSFEVDRIRNKLLALLLGIVAVFVRPFGFITLLALAINEILNEKNKKTIAVFYIPVAFILTAVVLFRLIPNFTEKFNNLFASLDDPHNKLLILKSLIIQINSFTISAFFTPLVVFLIFLFRNDIRRISKIKYFLVSFVFINFAISAQHVYGYLINSIDPGLLTRYINVSVIFIFIFSLIFLQNCKNFAFTFRDKLVVGLLIFLLFFSQYEYIKHSLNLDLSFFYNTEASTKDNLVIVKNFVIPVVILFYLSIFIAFLKANRKLLFTLLTILIVCQSILSHVWIIKFSSFRSAVMEYLEPKKSNVLFLSLEQEDQNGLLDNQYWRIMELSYWKLLTLSDNKISFMMLHGETDVEKEIDLPEEIKQDFVEKYDFVVTRFKLDLPEVVRSSPDGSRYFEYIYKL